MDYVLQLPEQQTREVYMQNKHRRWRIARVHSPYELASLISSREFSLNSGFAMDNYLLLNDSIARYESVFAVCRQHVIYGGLGFQPVHQVGSMDFTNSSFAECLDELSSLHACGCWPSSGCIEEIPFERLLL
jgi:hypothetical protein